ncbi:MAG: serine/threonine-protein kinase [Bryobacteraceae bacterium]
MSRDISIQELEQIYSSASELSGEARVHYLDSACEGKPLMRQQVEEMLAADAGFLAESILHRSLRSEPEVIGRWRVRSKLGEGGLGLVYRADTSEDGVTREAAVKILRPGFEEGFFRGRFQQERQILAGLTHPGIARFIDCGADAAGRSFLAMEFVDGELLTSYLGSGGVSLQRKVELFRGIAEAVQYLHSRLIVHGDLKPGNVMVTPEGATKLLDFGTARLLEGGPTSELTRLMLTPSYASPEQKRGEGPSVAGDIYSLGRLLQEMLAACSDPDLLAIARRCVAEEPEARYASVGSLVEDLHRWSTGYPVHARRQTLLYAMSRFTRRNWPMAGLAALLVVSLCAGWWNSRRMAEEARRQAVLARAHASESDRQRQRAETATNEASENASRYRHLLRRMLEEDTFTDSVLAGGVAPLERGYRVLIRELEKETAPSSLGDLAVAWRRLGSLLCHNGDYVAGLDAVSRGIRFASQWRERQPSAEARALEIVSHLTMMKMHRTRLDDAGAAREATATVRLFSQLPAAEKQDLTHRHSMQAARVLAAESVPSLEGKLALLRDAAKYTTRGIVGVSVRADAISRIILIHATLGEKEKLAPYCREADELLIWQPQVRRACGRPVAEFMRSPGIRILLRALNDDNQGHLWKLIVGGLYLNIAQQMWAAGAIRDAPFAFRLAELALREAAANDPNGPGVLDLRERIETARRLGRGQLSAER